MAPDLHAFTYSNWVGCYDTLVSTSGFCFLFGASCSSWLSKKQPTMATSSCEDEYRVVFIAFVECVWIRRLLANLDGGGGTLCRRDKLGLCANIGQHCRSFHKGFVS